MSRVPGVLTINVDVGVTWDVNDILLNIQGLPDAITREIMFDPNRPSHLTGHSLGAWRVNNLVRMGYIQSGTLVSLPVPTYPTFGTTWNPGHPPS